ncbi:Rho termination factor N-terminal domain-containing protein [Mycoplasmopsis felis]|uniref:Rho termination factor N-terminal domain-containing protein n=1 Tax=Mycoplasmopsis felis TaxID=33923 RepID=UPI002AF6C7CA|nr:Rho termination factor N-terminal domain-containing protein [Mycoplasmopsis felis]WQQ02844.1 Rho termination factor N-terminal domain-containing protein [Mycoplasmopsis felis]
MKNLYNNEIKTTSELWKAHNKEFKLWVFLYLVLIFLTTLLPTIYLIYLGSARHEYIEMQKRLTELSNNELYPSSVYESQYIREIVLTTFQNLFYWFVVVVFILSIKNSIKNKNFSYLSSWVIWLTWIMGLIHIIRAIIFLSSSFDTTILKEFSISMFLFSINIINVILYFILIVFVDRKVKAVKKAFVYIQTIKAMEELSKEYMENIRTGNPYAPSGFKTETKKEEKNQENIEDSFEYKKLNDLTQEELHSIAKKLNIVGYDELTKDELIKKILIYTKKAN